MRKQEHCTNTREMTHKHHGAGKNQPRFYHILQRQPEDLPFFIPPHFEQMDAVQEFEQPLTDAIDVFDHEQAAEHQTHTYEGTPFIEQGSQSGWQWFEGSATPRTLL